MPSASPSLKSARQHGKKMAENFVVFFFFGRGGWGVRQGEGLKDGAGGGEDGGRGRMKTQFLQD